MPSGNFATVSIDSITLDRSTRQRRELTNIPELARSIANVGLINPPVVSRESGYLIAGERRLTAVISLGWTHIPVQWAEELNEAELQLIELEENVKRVGLNWRDQCAAVENYHCLRVEMNPEWTGSATAEALGVSESEVSSRRAVQAALDSGDTLVNEADKYSVARGIVERKTARAREYAVDSIDQMLSPSQVGPSAISRTEEQEAHTTYLDDQITSTSDSPIILGEFADVLAPYSGPKFNFIHCDFPYGINANTHHGSAADKFGGYEDTEDVYWKCLDSLTKLTCIAESAHMMFWYSMDFHNETVEYLREAGWVVNPFPLIWFRNDNSGIMPDPKRGGRRVYETALHCTRGDRFVVKPVAMLFPTPNTKTIHMSEKPLPALAHFFRMFVDESTVMLDPTCGSANAVAQAKLSGAKSVMGIERDETFHTDAVRNYDRLTN